VALRPLAPARRELPDGLRFALAAGLAFGFAAALRLGRAGGVRFAGARCAAMAAFALARGVRACARDGAAPPR